jgi:hypothetical protein
MERTICCFAKNLTILSIIASLCLFPFETCYGGRASTSLGSTQGVNDNPPYPPPAEILLDNSTARFIATLAVFRSYEKVNQWYGANTTWNNIYLAANASGQQYGIAFTLGMATTVPIVMVTSITIFMTTQALWYMIGVLYTIQIVRL